MHNAALFGCGLLPAFGMASTNIVTGILTVYFLRDLYLQMHENGQLSLETKSILLATGALVFIGCCSSIYNTAGLLGIWQSQTPWRIPVAMLGILALLKESDAKWLISGLSIGMALLAFVIFAQIYGIATRTRLPLSFTPTHRHAGFFDNAHTASGVAMGAMFFLIATLPSNSMRKRTLSIIGALVVTIVLAGQRIHVLMLLLALVAVSSRKIKIVVLGLTPIAGYFAANAGFYITRLVNVDTYVSGLKTRINIWTSAWQMFCDNFLLGVGPGQFRSVIRTMGFDFGHAHNNILMILAETGLVGFISWLGLIYYLLFWIKKPITLNMWVWVGSLCCVGMIEANLYDAEVLQTNVMLFVAASAILFRHKQESPCAY